MKENRRTNKTGALRPILLIACIFVPQSGALAGVEDAQKLRMEGQPAAALVELERLVRLGRVLVIEAHGLLQAILANGVEVSRDDSVKLGRNNRSRYRLR